jgi:hypothetical protein
LTASLRVTVRAVAEIDAQLRELDWFRAVRSDLGTTIECLDEQAGMAAVALARGGAAAEMVPPPPGVTRGDVPAVVGHLEPLRIANVVDTIVARRVSTAEATAHLMRARRVFLVRRPDRERVRAVLRGTDGMLAWRRIVWAPRAAILSGSLRGARPIVFDREALEGGAERYAFVSSNAFTRWLSA